MSKNKREKSLLGTMVSVSGVVALGKVLGFVKQMITADAFGANIQTDIISLSEGLVSNVDYLLIQALTTAFIPTYIYVESQNEKDCKRFVSDTIKLFFVITVGIALLFIFGANAIAKIMAPSYDSNLLSLLAKYITIVAPILVIMVELAIFNSLLKANKIFIPGELIGFNQSAILIVLILLFGKTVGPNILIVGFYVYAVFNLVFLMIYSRRKWAIALKGNPFTNNYVKKLATMMGPLLLGYSMVFVNQQVDKIIVSGLGEGTITALSYAAVLSNFICTFIGSIAGVLFTYITQSVMEGNDGDVARLTSNTVIQISTVFLPISVLTFLNSGDIVQIVFGRGKFDSAAVGTCATALTGYSIMFVPYVMREVFSRVQYAYGDSKRPMINSSIAIVFNVGFSILLSRFMGVLGVTLATSISVIICAMLNINSTCTINRFVKVKDYFRYLPQWIMGVAVCVVVTYVGRAFLYGIPTVLRFIAIASVASGIYFLLTYSIIKPIVNKIFRK